MPVSAPHARAHWHDAYDAQMELWRWYRGPVGEGFLALSYRDNAVAVGDETRKMMMDLYNGERTRLLDLDPIYVSAEMCEVVAAASTSFEPEPLLLTDLITPRGFLYYETAFPVPDRFEKPSWIKGISWQRVFNTHNALTHDEHEKFVGELFDGYNSGDYQPGLIAEIEAQVEKVAEPWGITLSIYSDRDQEKISQHSGFPRLILLHVTPWYFGMSFDGNEIDENGVPTGAAWWWRIVQTTFRLMQQRISHKTVSRPDRATRREAKKLGIEDEREVVVVQLRREAGERHEPTGKDVPWSHRWIVSGHWRNQPYPSEGIHRQIWISPHVKGPEDKPLIVRPRRVFQWTR